MVLADSHRIPRAPCYSGNTVPDTHQPVPPTGVSPTTPRLPRRFSYRPAHAPPLRQKRKQDSPTTPHTQPLPSITRTRFNHHPLSLATTHGISSPTGTEMFHFPASPPTPYTIQMQVTRHNSCRVPPFGNPRITARQPAPRGISQATASFIGPRCQGIHRTLIKTNNTQHNTTHGARATRTTPARAARRTKQENKQTGDQQHNSRYRGRPQMLASTMQFTTNPPTTPDPTQAGGAQGARTPGRTAPEPDSMPRPPTPPPPPGGDPDGPPHTTESRRSEGGEDPGPRPTADNPRPQRPRQLMNPLERR